MRGPMARPVTDDDGERDLMTRQLIITRRQRRITGAAVTAGLALGVGWPVLAAPAQADMPSTASLRVAAAGDSSSPSPSPSTPKAPKTKVVKIGAKQFPRFVDTPGAGGTVTFTNVAGAVWKLGGTAVTFADKEKTKTLAVTAAATATVEAAPADSKGIYALAGPATWAFPVPSSDGLELAAADLTVQWLDFPGTKKDAVQLTKVDGVTWKVGTDVYDAATFGKKSTLQVKATAATAVTAELGSGVTLSGGASVPAFTNTLTAAETITYTDAQLTAALSVGDDPDDETKGLGKGASQESVLVKPLLGVKWAVGSGKPKAYKALTHVPVDAGDLDDSGGVTVAAAADKGYAVPKDWKTTVTFTDVAAASTIPVPSNKTVLADLGGVAKDTLTLPPLRGVTWFAAAPDNKGKYVYKALKAPKSGNVVYKVKHPKVEKGKTAPPTLVKYRAVPDRGYVVTGGGVKEASFSQADITIPASSQPMASGTTLTVPYVAGIATWTVTMKVADKDQKISIKAADFLASGAQSLTFTAAAAPAFDVKEDKGYIIAK